MLLVTWWPVAQEPALPALPVLSVLSVLPE